MEKTEQELGLEKASIIFEIKESCYRQCLPPFSNYFANCNGSIITNQGHFVNTHENNAGYEMVSVIKDNGRHTTTTVQHLVALAWLPNPKHLSDVDHKDDNKLNNSVDNLQWLSHRDNLKKHHRSSLTQGHGSVVVGRKVIKVSTDGTTKTYHSISSAAKDNDLSFSSVRGSANRQLALNRDYYFEFAQSDKQMEEA
jgi:hypothetical protein